MEFSKQFLITRSLNKFISLKFNTHIFQNYVIHYHNELLFSTYSLSNVEIILLGDIYDSKNNRHSQNTILRMICEAALNSFDTFVEYFSYLSGKFVMLLFLKMTYFYSMILLGKNLLFITHMI